MQNILIPTDFSLNALKAAEFAVTQFGFDVNYVLINSYEVPHSGTTMLISIADILNKDSVQLLEEEQARLLTLFPDLEGKITIKSVSGMPHGAIKKMVDSEKVDTVVMGTKGATGLKGILVGSVASNTVAQVKCPILAVPEDSPIKKIEKVLFAVDDKTLNNGTLPDGFADFVKKVGAKVVLLNVVAPGELNHVGNSEFNQRKPMGAFEEIDYTIEFIEDDDVSKGIVSYLKQNDFDLLAMITRKDDLFSKMFGTSNTKQMMISTKVPLLAFH